MCAMFSLFSVHSKGHNICAFQPPKHKTELHTWQEFKNHGVKLQGPLASLASAGSRGKFTSNIQRDILRRVTKHDPEQVIFLEGEKTVSFQF